MDNRLIFLLFICIHHSGSLYAQWTEKDSVWLQDVLSGKEQLKLNPEFEQAIQSGTLINTDVVSPKEQMKSSPSQMPISKDFTEYISPGKTIKDIDDSRDVDPYSMPPAVLMLYGLNIPFKEEKWKAAFMIPQKVKDNAARPSGRSFDDMLRSVFSPAFRARERNKKHANAWKTYNDYW